MEIGDYLALIRRRLWWFVAIPLLSGGLVVAGLLSSREASYRATATVSVSVVNGARGSQFSGPQGVRSLVDSFREAAERPPVRAAVSQATGVPVPRLRERGAVAVESSGDSTLIRVTARMPQPAQAQAVAQAVSVESMRFLLQPQIALAERIVQQAEAAVQQAETDVAQTAPDQVQFATRAEIRRQAIARLDDARAARDGVQALLAAFEEGALVAVGEAIPEPLTPVLVRQAAGGVGSGIFLALLVVAVVEVWDRERQRRRAAPGAAAPVSEDV